jgi:hypothetical protein
VEEEEHTSVTHSPAWWSRNTSDKAHDRFASVVLLEPLRSILLRTTANLTNHDDAIRLRILNKDIQAVNEIRATERITSNTHNKGLAQSSLRSLVHGLVSERARARHDADATALVDEAGHDADLALAWRNDAGAVGTDEAGLGLRLEHVCYADHVVLGDAFGDADDEGDLGNDGFFDTSGGEGRSASN